jgi:hypothetical protein
MFEFVVQNWYAKSERDEKDKQIEAQQAWGAQKTALPCSLHVHAS